MRGDNLTLGDLDSQAAKTLIGSRTLTNPTLVIGTTASKGNVAAFDYCIGGVAYTSAAAVDGVVFAAADGNIADGSYRIYLISVNAAGTIATTPCVADDSTELPDLASGYIAIGAIKIATAGAVFIPSTTLLSAGTVTDTYTNYAVLPDAYYS